jgi:hypothetical protein
VSKKKTIAITTKTGNPFAPNSANDLTFLQYRQTDTEFAMKTIVWGADQFIISDIKYYENWEMFSPDPQSNQVVFRCVYKIDWLSKPFGIWKMINSSIVSRV